MFQDKTLTCAGCGAEFVFSAGEQEFHASKGFTSEPRRCPSCRAARKAAAGGAATPNTEGTESAAVAPRPSRTLYDATCAECGKPTKVPFQPTGSRPVFCSDCYRAKAANGGNARSGASGESGRGSFSGAPRGGSFSGGRSAGGTRPFASRSSELRSGRDGSFSSFESYDFSDFGGADPFGGGESSGGRGNRKRGGNSRRESNKERSRKEGGGRPRGRVFDDEDDDEMYY